MSRCAWTTWMPGSMTSNAPCRPSLRQTMLHAHQQKQRRLTNVILILPHGPSCAPERTAADRGGDSYLAAPEYQPRHRRPDTQAGHLDAQQSQAVSLPTRRPRRRAPPGALVARLRADEPTLYPRSAARTLLHRVTAHTG